MVIYGQSMWPWILNEQSKTAEIGKKEFAQHDNWLFSLSAAGWEFMNIIV